MNLESIIRRLGAAALLCAAVFLCSPAHAQTSYLTGAVQLFSGQAVPGATVRVCAAGATGIPCSPAVTVAGTDTLGNYDIAVAPGNYVVCFSGHFPSRCENRTAGGGASGTLTISHGAKALGTSAIPSHTCSAVTDSATGVVVGDNIEADFNANTDAVLGYEPGAMLTIKKYASTDTVNFSVCNNTGDSITPDAVTVVWRVLR